MVNIDEGLQKMRTVSLIGKIDDKQVNEIIVRLFQLQLENPTEETKLLIDSRGGHIDPAMKLHDVICYGMTMPIRAIVIGRCDSAATFVLLACKTRLCLPHAKFIIHSGAISGISLTMDEMTPKKLDDLKREVEKNVAEMTKFYGEKMGKSIGDVQRMIARGDADFDSQMSADEAKEIGLITEVITENLGMFPGPE